MFAEKSQAVLTAISARFMKPIHNIAEYNINVKILNTQHRQDGTRGIKPNNHRQEHADVQHHHILRKPPVTGIIGRK